MAQMVSKAARYIPEKINTPVELPRVSRLRLLSILRESLAGCNSTILSGRAGTGKTMLLTDFARHCGRQVAWYKIDAPDSELKVFVEYLCASISRQRPGFGEKMFERLGASVGFEDVPLLVEYLVYELLESDRPLLIVVDDLHLIYDADWVVPFFRRLLPLLPREVHLILVGRSLPPTPLWRMRSKQSLFVLDETALSFTLGETHELLASYGAPADEAAALLERTRGRAATLDAQARAVAAAAAEEAARVAAARGIRRSRALRLVKGFSRQPRLRTA